MKSFTKNTGSVSIQIDGLEEVTVFPNNYPKVFSNGKRIMLDFIEGDPILLTPTDDLKFDQVVFSGTLDELKAAVLATFPNANSGSGGSGTIATKADDTAAFAALSNGQWNIYEVAGEVSIYAKDSNGVQKILTL